jgi:hypothetical protein
MAGETMTQPPNANTPNDAKPRPANSASTSVGHEKLEVKIRSGPKGETLKQLIALRSAVLMPPGVQLTDELSKTLPPNAVLCYVGDISTTNNIEIYADELVLLRDPIYAFRRKHRSISCRTVKFAGKGDRVTFDLRWRHLRRREKRQVSLLGTRLGISGHSRPVSASFPPVAKGCGTSHRKKLKALQVRTMKEAMMAAVSSSAAASAFPRMN